MDIQVRIRFPKRSARQEAQRDAMEEAFDPKRPNRIDLGDGAGGLRIWSNIAAVRSGSVYIYIDIYNTAPED